MELVRLKLTRPSRWRWREEPPIWAPVHRADLALWTKIYRLRGYRVQVEPYDRAA